MTTRVPTIPPLTGDNADYILTNIKMLLDVREGRAGDKLDSNITYRDLVNLGLAKDPSGNVIYVGGSAALKGLPVVPFGVDNDGYDPTKDLTPPPAPTDVTAVGSIGVIYLTWNQPTYRNHSYAEVWRSETDDIGAAILIGQASSQGYVDVPGDSITRYYWVRFVSKASIKGPYSQESTSAKADIDPAILIKKIEGQILETSLSQTLSERIKRIELGSDVLGSIQNSVALAGKGATAALNEERTARVSGDNILSSRVDTVAAFIDTKSRVFYQATEPSEAAGDTMSVGDMWIDTNITYAPDYVEGDYVIRSNRMYRWDGSAWVEAMDYGFADWFSAIRDEKTARTSADSSLATQITTLEAATSAANSAAIAAIEQEATTRTSADSSLAQSIDTLISTVTTDRETALAAITAEQTARTSGDSALASSITALQTSVENAAAAIQTESTARANALSSEAARVDTLVASLMTAASDLGDTLTAAIQSESAARVNAVAAEANARQTLEASLVAADAEIVSSIETEALTRATADGSLFAQYTVKIDQNGHVSGFGLASETVNGATESAFIIRADKFAVVDPASTLNNLTDTPSAETVPFAVVGGSVYLKSAIIQDASISSAKIASLVANKITSGYINAVVGINGAKVYGAELYSGGSTTVNTDAGGNVTGFTVANPTVKISGGNATFVASNFKVSNSATGTPTDFVPFQVVNNTVYISSAMIQNASISLAQIDKATITDLSSIKANMGTITAGKMQSSDSKFVIDLDNKTISIET